MSAPYISFKKQRRDNKGYFPIMVVLIIAVSILLSFGTKQEKKYRLEVTLEEANALVSCLEQSQAPAVTVNAIIKLVAGQINPQLQAEQKKVQDSLDKSKPKPKN